MFMEDLPPYVNYRGGSSKYYRMQIVLDEALTLDVTRYHLGNYFSYKNDGMKHVEPYQPKNLPID